ncbi:MAG: cytochrome c [Chitinophagales bacterium]|nr:cytochrome c [Chitinophagales bacterium]
MLYRIFIFAIVLMSCGGNSSDHSTAAAVRTSDGKLQPDGMAVFRQRCVTCHGADGTLGLNGAKDLTQSALTLEERVNIITNGKKLMTPFGTVLTPEEIQAVAEYTLTLKK